MIAGVQSGKGVKRATHQYRTATMAKEMRKKYGRFMINL